MTERIVCLVLGAYCLLPSAGCGYTVHSALPGSYRTVCVQPFTNQIDITTDVTDRSRYKVYRPRLEADITNAVVNRYIFDGNLRITDASRANLLLTGALKDFRRDPLRYDSNRNVEEYRLSLVVDLEMRELAGNTVLWSEPSFTGDATFFVTGSLAEAERTALDRAVEDLARRVVERTVENW